MPVVIQRPRSTPQDTEYVGEAGEWLVMIDNTLARSCFITRFYNDGTIFRLSNDARYSVGDEIGGIILLTNPAWSSLTPEQEVSITFTLDNYTPWDASAGVIEMGGFRWLSVTSNASTYGEFTNEIGTARSLAVSRGDRHVVTLDLANSAEATASLRQCQASANQARIAADPFAE